MGRYSGKSCSILTMLLLTTTFLLVEIIVGHISNSLALVADAFHMLSDTMALVVGLLAVKFARKGQSKMQTYGWARAEIVGALVNAVFLVALCFTIFVEAVERLAMREPIEDAYLLLYVGGTGLAINLLGLCLFHNHAHGHTHGGHTHGSHGHSHHHTNGHAGHHGHSHQTLHKINSETSFSCEDGEDNSSNLLEEDGCPAESQPAKTGKQVKSHQLNMRGVFIHVLGDALGSVVVMFSAGLTIIARTYMYPCNASVEVTLNATSLENSEDSGPCEIIDPQWVLCIDPILSLVLVAIILCTSLPLLKQTALVLMQCVPGHLETDLLTEEINQMDGVLGIHEFHIWSLAGNKVIASLHVETGSLDDYVVIAQKIKNYLHNMGIHSVTIQPEFSELQKRVDGRLCALECGPNMLCHADTCCAINEKILKKRASRSIDSDV